MVYYKTFTLMDDAIVREKQLKEWHRAWKIALNEQANPDWCDLWPEVCGAGRDVSEEGGLTVRGLRRDDCALSASGWRGRSGERLSQVRDLGRDDGA